MKTDIDVINIPYKRSKRKEIIIKSKVMAGRRVRGGQTYGKSDKIAQYPDENLISPGDIGATLTSQMAIDPHTEIMDMTDRPFPLVRGEVIQGIL